MEEHVSKERIIQKLVKRYKLTEESLLFWDKFEGHKCTCPE